MATSVPYTTFAAAVGPTDERVTLTSGTDAAANRYLVATRNREAMLIKEMISTTVAKVTRGLQGTVKCGHDILDRVFVAPPGYFANSDPFGVASATAVSHLPRVVLPSCDVFVPFNTEWLKIPIVPQVRTLRTRVTIAQVNAGATLLPALPGYAYRLVDAYIIAVGGAAAAVTSVDILATLSAASRKLVSYLVAGLTQSTVLRMGAATNGVVLADGASLTVNDANTAITILKAGSDVTTATHFDVVLEYVIEPA